MGPFSIGLPLDTPKAAGNQTWDSYIWWTNIAMERSIIFNRYRKPTISMGHFQWRCDNQMVYFIQNLLVHYKIAINPWSLHWIIREYLPPNLEVLFVFGYGGYGVICWTWMAFPRKKLGQFRDHIWFAKAIQARHGRTKVSTNVVPPSCKVGEHNPI